MKTTSLAILVLAAAFAGHAHALSGLQSRITLLYGGGLPQSALFQMSVGTPACMPGQWLTWSNADTANNQAVYALLLAAVTSDKSVTVFIDEQCTAQQIMILSR